MSTNEANIKITVDDSDLLATDQRLERVEEGLEAVAREARQAGKAFGRVGVAAGGAVAGLVSMELAKRALETATRAATASIEAFAEVNEEAAGYLAATSAELDILKVAFGEALIGGENLTNMTGQLNFVLQSLTDLVNTNQEAFQRLSRTGLQIALNGAISLGQGFIRLAQFATFMKSVIQASAVAFQLAGAKSDEFAVRLTMGLQDAISGATRTMADFAQTLLDFAGPMLGPLGDELQVFVDSIDGVAEAQENYTQTLAEEHAHVVANITRLEGELRAAQDSGLETVNDLQTAYDALTVTREGLNAAIEDGTIAMHASSEAESSGGSGTGSGEPDEEVKLLSDVLAEQAVVRKAAGFALLEAQRLEQERQLEAQAEFLAAQQMAEEEAFAIRQASVRRQQAELKELRDKHTAIATDGAKSLQSALLAVSVGTAKQRKAALKKALGQELIQRGGALIAQGIGNAIALNPKGGFEIAGGASMVAAGAKLSGGGGGKGGSPTANTTPPSSTTNTTNITYNQSTQFGFVGDRRAAIKELEEINQGSQDRGY